MQRAVLSSLLLGPSLSLLGACPDHAHPRGPGPATAPAGQAAAVAPVPPVPLGEGPPLATPGEHMQYTLSLRGIALATYDLGIGEVTEHAGAKVLVAQGHAMISRFASFIARVDDRFTSWIDVTNGRSLRFQTDEYASGSKTDIEHAIVDLAGRTDDVIAVHYHLNDQQPRLESQQVHQPVVWDHNAFLLALRAWEGAPGQAASLEVFRSRFLWHVDVRLHGKEMLVTPLGELPALRIEGRTHRLDRQGRRDPSAAERLFTIWISDDEGRVPLEIKAITDYGPLRMQIIDYQPGTGQRLRP